MRYPAEDVRSGGGRAPSEPIRSALAEAPHDRLTSRGHALLESGQLGCARSVLRQIMADGCEGAARVVRSTGLPTRKGVIGFFSYQLLINSVAWTAGLIAAGLVASFFEVKGMRNLWGLAASGSRTLVSAEHYQLIVSLASFFAGLAMMIFVRHFILRWIDEIRSLRLERERGRSASPDVRAAPPGAPTPDFDGLQADSDQ